MICEFLIKGIVWSLPNNTCTISINLDEISKGGNFDNKLRKIIHKKLEEIPGARKVDKFGRATPLVDNDSVYLITSEYTTDLALNQKAFIKHMEEVRVENLEHDGDYENLYWNSHKITTFMKALIFFRDCMIGDRYYMLHRINFKEQAIFSLIRDRETDNIYYLLKKGLDFNLEILKANFIEDSDSFLRMEDDNFYDLYFQESTYERFTQIKKFVLLKDNLEELTKNKKYVTIQAAYFKTSAEIFEALNLIKDNLEPEFGLGVDKFICTSDNYRVTFSLIEFHLMNLFKVEKAILKSLEDICDYWGRPDLQENLEKLILAIIQAKEDQYSEIELYFDAF